jgi:hypothetical protein
MKKFKKVIELKDGLEGNNKFDKFIFGEFEGRLYGDWGVYEDGEERGYDIDLMEKNDDEDLCYIDDLNYGLEDEDKILLEDLKEYVGEGICYDNGYGDNNWYNVEFKGDIMEISFINIKE